MISDFCSYNISPSKIDIELHGIWRNNETNLKVNLKTDYGEINDKINI